MKCLWAYCVENNIPYRLSRTLTRIQNPKADLDVEDLFRMAWLVKCASAGQMSLEWDGMGHQNARLGTVRRINSRWYV